MQERGKKKDIMIQPLEFTGPLIRQEAEGEVTGVRSTAAASGNIVSPGVQSTASAASASGNIVSPGVQSTASASGNFVSPGVKPTASDGVWF